MCAPNLVRCNVSENSVGFTGCFFLTLLRFVCFKSSANVSFFSSEEYLLIIFLKFLYLLVKDFLVFLQKFLNFLATDFLVFL